MAEKPKKESSLRSPQGAGQEKNMKKNGKKNRKRKKESKSPLEKTEAAAERRGMGTTKKGKEISSVSLPLLPWWKRGGKKRSIKKEGRD